MKSFPFQQVNWLSSIFLIATFFGTLIGVPLFFIFAEFEWTYLALFFGFFILTGMSITLGYHRLFAHRSFQASKPVRFFTLIFGAAAFEDSALDWASDHRDHHKHTDHDDDDPYSISKGFFWAHIGWIFFKLYPRQLNNVADLKKDPLVMWQHRHHRTIALLVGLALPALIGFAFHGAIGLLGGFLFGGLARLVAVQHSTFCINSLCHMIGKRPYDKQSSARDSGIMAIFTFGEGYHNYHHSFQHDYRNGVKPWQWDPTKWTIWSLEKLGLASGLRRVPEEKVIMAQVRQLRKETEAHLNTAEQHQDSCPKHRDAYQRLKDVSRHLAEEFRELEEAAAKRVKLSGQKLRHWRMEVEHARTLLALSSAAMLA